MPRKSFAFLAALTLASLSSTGFVRGQDACTKAEFAQVVDQTGQALREINARNAPTFRAKLRELKKAKGWSEEVFLAKARPLVEDDQITVYDERADDLLAKINSLGDEGGITQPDCLVLEELRSHLDRLIETIETKWTYMFKKVEKALKSQ